MLVENELKIARILIMDLVKGRNFNKKSLAGPNMDDLTNFHKITKSVV